MLKVPFSYLLAPYDPHPGTITYEDLTAAPDISISTRSGNWVGTHLNSPTPSARRSDPRGTGECGPQGAEDNTCYPSLLASDPDAGLLAMKVGALIPRCAHKGNLLSSFLGAHLNVLPKEGDPPGRPYKNLYYFYERNSVLRDRK